MATTVQESCESDDVTIIISNERGPVGPAGPAGLNSITSETTSDGTADLSVHGIQASDEIGANSLYGTDINGVNLAVDNATLGAANIIGTLTANHIHGNLAGSLYMHVRAGENLSKGDPVYVSGSHGSGANMIPIVSRADASDLAKMPAIAIMDGDVTANANGHAVISGTITDFDTNAYTVNATLYVANGGGLTASKPTNVQPVARVERVNTNNGGIVVKVNGLYSDISPANIGAVADDDARLTDERTPLDNSATNDKLADMAEGTIKGRAIGTGTGDPQDLTAAQVQAIAVTPSSIQSAGAQTTSVAFLDRFDNSSRYAPNATLTHNVSLPEIGGTAYRISTNGTPRPRIVSGALEPQGDSLDYFANVVTTTGGRFNMGLVVDWARTSVFATAVNNGGFTIAVSEQELVSAGGSINGIGGTNPIHVTIRQDGVSEAGFYLGASFTCLNATVSSGVFPWNARGTTMPFGEKMAILFRISGDILEIEAVGIGTLYFTHPDISTRVAPTTYFFYEPVGPDVGTDYRQICRLYRWWVNADEYDQLAGYGSTNPGNSGGPHRYSGQIQVYPNGQTTRRASDTGPGSSTASLVATGAANVTKGSNTRPTGGAWLLENQVAQNYGYNETGAGRWGFMVGAFDTNLNSPVSSSAGSETSLSGCGFEPMWGFENADWQEWVWRGTLVGANNKRIRLNLAFGGGDPGTPGNLVDSGTITSSGFFEIRLFRYTNSTASHVFYGTMHVNGVLVSATRTAWNGLTNYVNGTFRTTTVDAGGVVVDSYTHQISRVNMT